MPLKPDIMKLADTMAKSINDNRDDFGLSVTARRKLLVEQKVEDLDNVHVWVVPEELEASRIDRKQFARNPSISIGVIRRLKATPTDVEIGQIVELTEQIVDHFTTTQRFLFDSVAGLYATVTGFEWSPLYWPPYVRQFNQVTCVPTIQWEFYR